MPSKASFEVWLSVSARLSVFARIRKAKRVFSRGRPSRSSTGSISTAAGMAVDVIQPQLVGLAVAFSRAEFDTAGTTKTCLKGWWSESLASTERLKTCRRGTRVSTTCEFILHRQGNAKAYVFSFEMHTYHPLPEK